MSGIDHDQMDQDPIKQICDSLSERRERICGYLTELQQKVQSGTQDPERALWCYRELLASKGELGEAVRQLEVEREILLLEAAENANTIQILEALMDVYARQENLFTRLEPHLLGMVTPDLLDDDDRARSRVAEHRDALVLLHVNVGVEDAEEALPQP